MSAAPGSSGTHLHTFWAIVPRGADVSRESLRGGREQGSPTGTTKGRANSIGLVGGCGRGDLDFHPILRGIRPSAGPDSKTGMGVPALSPRELLRKLNETIMK